MIIGLRTRATKDKIKALTMIVSRFAILKVNPRIIKNIMRKKVLHGN